MRATDTRRVAVSVEISPYTTSEGAAAAAREWVEDSVSAQDDAHAVFVARVAGRVVGMVSVSEQRYWSGDVDAYLGELVTEESMEGQGAANSRALTFYEGLGYRREEVRLTRRLTS